MFAQDASELWISLRQVPSSLSAGVRRLWGGTARRSPEVSSTAPTPRCAHRAEPSGASVRLPDSLVALNKKKRVSFVLEKKEQLSSGFVPVAPTEQGTLRWGYPSGQRVLNTKTRRWSRAYTPSAMK